MIICFISTEIDDVVINFTLIFWSIIEMYNVLFSFSFHVLAIILHVISLRGVELSPVMRKPITCIYKLIMSRIAKCLF